MFSVGATPYNSRSRQLYGGWTLEDASAAQSPAMRAWAKKKYYEMAAKFGPTPGARRAAKAYHTMYTDEINANPALSRQVMKIGRLMGKNAVRPAMTDAQRASIFNFFRGNVKLDQMYEPEMQQMFSAVQRAPFLQEDNFPQNLRAYYPTFTYNGDIWRNAGEMYSKMKKAGPPTITSNDLVSVGLDAATASAALNYQRNKTASKWGRRLDPLAYTFNPAVAAAPAPPPPPAVVPAPVVPAEPALVPIANLPAGADPTKHFWFDDDGNRRNGYGQPVDAFGNVIDMAN